MTLPRSVVPVAQQRDPVPDHAGLPEGERDEDADDVQLDELGDVRLVDDQQHRAASASRITPFE